MKKNITLLSSLILFCLFVVGQNKIIQNNITDLSKWKKDFIEGGMSTLSQTQNEHYTPGAFKTSISDFGDSPEWNWSKQMGGSGSDHARGIISDNDGNIYTTGSFSGEIIIESNTYSSTGSWDAFVAKFQNNGTLLWFKQFPASAGNQIESHGINKDNEGNLLITGYYTGNVTLDNINLFGTEGKTPFFAKLNNNGDVLMANTCEGEETIGFRIVSDDNSNIYIITSQYGYPYHYSYSTIAKYNSGGAFLWAESFPNSFNDMEIHGSTLYFTGTLWNGGYIGEFYFSFISYYEAFIAKADLDLNFEWAFIPEHEGFGNSLAMDMYVDPNENLYITGRYSSDLIWPGSQLTGSNGFISKFDASGTSLWSSPYNLEQNFYPLPGCICGDHNSTFISYYGDSYLSNFQTNTISKFNAENGDFIGNTEMDFEINSSYFNPVDNSICMSGERNQLNVVAKSDNYLSELWKVDFDGNSASVEIISTGTDQYGFVYVYGYTSNTINYLGHDINEGLFLLKQNTSGDIIWIEQFPGGTGEADWGNYLVVDTLSGNLYITEIFHEPLIIPGISTLIPAQEGSIFLIKYDFDGNFQWANQEDFYSDQLCISADHSGNVLLCGLFSGNISVGNTNLSGEHDIFISKYNNQGDFQWVRTAGGESIEYVGLISTDALNNIYLTGEFTSENVYVHNQTLTLNQGDGNILIAKFDESGNVQWVDSKAGSLISWGDEYCWPTSIETDDYGYTYIKGWFKDSTFFDNIMLTNPYLDDPRFSFFIAKLDQEGNTLWVNAINEHRPHGFDYNKMSLDKDGNIYFGASMRDTIHFGDEYMYISQGNNDMFISRYSSTGELDWIKTIQSSSGNYWLSSVSVFDESSIIISGHFSDFINFGNIPMTSNNKHAFITLIGDYTGITVYEKDKDKSLFDIYPNPSQYNLNITLSEENQLKDVRLVISDIGGKIIFNKNYGIIEKAIKIDISDFSRGVYFIKLETGKKQQIEKIVLN